MQQVPSPVSRPTPPRVINEIVFIQERKERFYSCAVQGGRSHGAAGRRRHDAPDRRSEGQPQTHVVVACLRKFLFMFSQEGATNCVMELVAAGASTLASYNGDLPLHLASKLGQPQVPPLLPQRFARSQPAFSPATTARNTSVHQPHVITPPQIVMLLAHPETAPGLSSSAEASAQPPPTTCSVALACSRVFAGAEGVACQGEGGQGGGWGKE